MKVHEPIRFVSGGRGTGKTHLGTENVLDTWDNGGMSVWIRNKDVEFQQNFRNTFLADMITEGKIEEPDRWTVSKEGVFYDKKDLVCAFMSINTFSNQRGGAWPEVGFIYFDEYIPEDLRYPPGNCGNAFNSLLNTVIRDREAKILASANNVSSINPYFAFYKTFPAPGKDITWNPMYSPDHPDEFTPVMVERVIGYRESTGAGGQMGCVNKSVGYSYAGDKIDPLDSMITANSKGEWAGFAIQTKDTLYGIVENAGRWCFKPATNLPNQILRLTFDPKCISNTVSIINQDAVSVLERMLESGKMRFHDHTTAWDVLHLIEGGV